jgi:Domain of unknown function (DUF4062)
MEVFLSSTVSDLKAYRDEVKQALTETGVLCYPSEDWVNAYAQTVHVVRERVEQSSSYYGIFAHFYGSVPPESSHSITAMEFRWAFARWQKERPPLMAVFMPELGSEVDNLLRVAAEEELERRFPGDPDQQQCFRELQKSFRDEVMSPVSEWRTVTYFRDQHHLGRQAVHLQGVWRQELLKASLGIGSGFAREPTEPELGRIGRHDELLAVKKALDAAATSKRPALLIDVNGSEDAGQGEFVQALAESVLRKRFRRPEGRRPPSDRYRLDGLLRWMGRVLAGKEVTTLDALAQLILAASQRQALAVLVDPVDAFVGGYAAFLSEFWRPLFERLELAGPSRKPCLCVIAVRYAAESDAASLPAVPSSQHAEVSVPLTTSLAEAEVIGWLAETEVPDPDGERHAEIAREVTRDRGGAVDGTPRRVFERLRRLDLWPRAD